MFCRHCGSELTSETTLRVCPGCGLAVEAAAAAPGASAPEPPPTAGGTARMNRPGFAGQTTATDTAPYDQAATPVARRGGRSLGRVLGAVGAVILVVLAVTVVQGVRGRSAGASSPDDLVQRLTRATVETDPAAAIALLDPDEMPGLGALYETAVTQARKGADIDVPGALAAVTITARDVAHTVTYLDAAETYAKVTFTGGTLTVDTRPDDLPAGIKQRITENGGTIPEADHQTAHLSQLTTTSMNGKRIDPFLVLVKEDGRWYVSITMTIGEYAVELADLPGGDFDATPKPGPAAASPERAVATLLDAAKSTVNTGKSDGPPLTGLLPEAQTRAFRVYGRSMRSWLGRASGQTSVDPDDPFAGGSVSPPSSVGSPTGLVGIAKDCSGCGVDYHDLKVSVRQNDSLTYAVIESVRVELKDRTCGWVDDGGDEWLNIAPDDVAPDGRSSESDRGKFGVDGSSEAVVGGTIDSGGPDGVAPDSDCTIETGSASWDGHCVSATSSHDPALPGEEDTSEKGCLDDELGDSGLSLTDFGVTDVHLVVARERGGWVIDPVATIMDYGRTALRHLSDPKIRAAIDADD